MNPRRIARVRRAGHAAVELALVFPVLFVMFVGVVEWGYFFCRELDLARVGRDAAAAGSRVRTVDDPAGRAGTRCVAALEAAGFVVATAEVETAMVTAVAGPTLHVALAVPYTPLSGLLPMPSMLRTSVTLRMQNR